MTHFSISYGWSLDRIEFTTNLERHFSAGGSGGSFHRFTLPVNDSPHDKHPRIIALGLGLGPHDAHQIRVHYLPVSGHHCKDISLEL